MLILATIISLIIANSPLKEQYNYLIGGIDIFADFNLHMIVNDFLMAIFFLSVGLEIKHEVLYGNLSSFKKASFPVISAIGGVLVPAIIFLIFNSNNEFSNGVGVPISTDIAFAVGIFMILKNKIDPKLKIFLLSLAVVDDLISILVIGILYSSDINIISLGLALLTLVVLLLMNSKFKVNKITPYMIVGLALWFFVYISGVHATISGVLVALAIPSKILRNENESIMKKLEHKLTPVCNLVILPLFALVNTAINLDVSVSVTSVDNLILGIVVALVVGKPIGIMLLSFVATKLNITEKPENTSWTSILCVSMLAGIGFTMAIFVAEIAFVESHEIINIAKISILGASLISIIITSIVVNSIYIYKNKFSHKGALVKSDISEKHLA